MALIRVDEEIRAITSKIRASDHRDEIVLIPALAARPDDLLQLLNEHEPDVVHFAGHASTKALAFLADDGTTKPVSEAALAQLFRTAGKKTRIVVLNACYTHRLAECLTEVVDSAIGMTRAITDKDAIVFAASFYRAIGFGKTIVEAVEQGTTALLLEGSADDAIVKVMTRSSIDGGPPESGNWRPISSNRNSEMRANAVDSQVLQQASRGAAEPFVVIPEAESIHEDQLMHILDKKIRAVATASIVFCDIDGLLGINAKYGIPTGNDVVRQSVAVLMGCAGTERIYRVRGDQFVIFLAERTVDDALLLARLCSERIKTIPWSLVTADLHISCTFSVAQCLKTETAARCLLRLVLAAKASKTRGSGNVVVASEFGRLAEALSDAQVAASLTSKLS